VPFTRPIASPIYRFTHLFTVLCEVEDATGATGVGALWFPSDAHARVVLQALRWLAPIAAEHTDAGELTAALRKEINFLGYKGVAVMAMSGLEMALQDLCLRTSYVAPSAPAERTTLPAYWSGFFLNESLDAWLDEAEIASALGFRAFKARLGRPQLSEDLHRVASLRNALPANSTLMLDAHQSWDVAAALQAAAALEPYRITWLEDPLIHTDYRGLASVVRASPIPIAAGENEYLHEGFEQLLETGVSYLLVDLERAGGIGEWWRIADLAHQSNAVVTPHLYPHVALRLCGQLAQTERWIEYVDWWDPLMAAPIEFVDGHAVVPPSQGTGFDVNADAVERFALAQWEELHDARNQYRN
jgi:L-alanine-DL-glutamate epimerase-like enolase superfamily enzyme